MNCQRLSHFVLVLMLLAEIKENLQGSGLRTRFAPNLGSGACGFMRAHKGRLCVFIATSDSRFVLYVLKVSMFTFTSHPNRP